MRKRSKLPNDFTESSRWWEGRIEFKAEWTFEGSPKYLKSRRCREPNPLSIRSVCQYI